MEYRVTWTVDVDADTPLDAAVKARGMQTRPNTTATVFDVVAREHGEDAGLPEEIDLSKDYRSPRRCRCQEGHHCGHRP